MTNKYSPSSEYQLLTCHPKLQTLFRRVLRTRDHTILKGHRGEAEQNAAEAGGFSKKKFPNSLHNVYPSRAVDVLPYLGRPVDWTKDREAMCYFAGFVMCEAAHLGIRIRWLGDSNGNLDLRDENLSDLPHFELHKDEV